MNDYPATFIPVNHVEPVPRRIRAFLGGAPVLDTTSARYVWEVSPYPQYYVPLGDIVADALVDEGSTQQTSLGTARVFGVRAGDVQHNRCALVYDDSTVAGVAGTVRFDWRAMDSWFEEDEQVFVHPRSPYARVDTLRSTRHITVSLGGVVLADSTSPVMLFETGLPTRYYLNRTDVDLTRLHRSTSRSSCPYKGTTSGYWSVTIDGTRYDDIAWAYDFPTREVLPIAGLIAFYNEKVDIALDGAPLERPHTHFA